MPRSTTSSRSKSKSPARKSVSQSKSRSRSRSASRSRKATTKTARSRSRSAGRSPARSPGRPRKVKEAISAVLPDAETPTRVSRRVQKNVVDQFGVDSNQLHEQCSDKELTFNSASRSMRIQKNKIRKQVTVTSAYNHDAHHLIPTENQVYTLTETNVADLNNNALLTKDPVKEGYIQAKDVIGEGYSQAKEAVNEGFSRTQGAAREARSTVREAVKEGVTQAKDKAKEVKLRAKAAGDVLEAHGFNMQTVGLWGLVLVPFVVMLSYYMALSCTKSTCEVVRVPSYPLTWKSYFDPYVAGVCLAFYAAVFILTIIPVGSVCEGQTLVDGRRLKYRCNGFLLLLAATAGFTLAFYSKVDFRWFNDHYLQFVTTGVVLSILTSVLTSLKACRCPLKDRAPGADGSMVNDFWMGRELNPRICGVDIKFTLFRSAMMAWLLIDWVYLAEQFRAMGTVTPAMLLLVLFHTVYIFMAIKNESVMPMSMDFSQCGPGFMFMWGAFAFMPYAFSMTARFLALHPEEAVENRLALAGVTLMNVIGLMMFVGANWQKSEFRRNPYNPALSHLTSIPTSTGKRILCSGWWGFVRRPNYLGDLMMALSWSLLCGHHYAWPYFYPLYLAVLLVPRLLNDEEACRKRYADAWDKYTSEVPYRLVPYVF